MINQKKISRRSFLKLGAWRWEVYPFLMQLLPLATLIPKRSTRKAGSGTIKEIDLRSDRDDAPIIGKRYQHQLVIFIMI
jgi:hypothetical protein